MPKLCEKASACKGMWGLDLENNRKPLDYKEQGGDMIHSGICKNGSGWLTREREFGVGQQGVRDHLEGLRHCYGKK